MIAGRAGMAWPGSWLGAERRLMLRPPMKIRSKSYVHSWPAILMWRAALYRRRRCIKV